jgi:protein-export membrane protein SecD
MPASKIVVQRRVMVSGDRLTDASQGFDSQTGQPVVNFRFDNVGARQFGDVTKEHVDHLFAIVLDNEVISAPRIISPILGGSGQITGSGTAKEANDLAILLRAGALPAPLKPLEERSVGAELGKDSIDAGRKAALAGLPKAELLWASPREVLNLVQAEEIGCDIITITADLLAKVPTIGKDLDQFSLDTVKMFYSDAKAAGFKLI